MSDKNEFLVIDSSIPSGMICWFYKSSAPEGYVICNGKWYSPDGSESSDTETETCTIATPNLIGRYPLGSTDNIGTTLNSGLPKASTDALGSLGGGWEGNLGGHYLAAAISNSGNNAPTPTITFENTEVSTFVRPPSVKLLPCMKL